VPIASCGPANNNDYASASAVSSAGACSNGYVTTEGIFQQGGKWSWYCNGEAGKTLNDTGSGECVGYISSSCGSANGATFASAPSSNLCSRGSASSLSGSGPWTWSCKTHPRANGVSCRANKSSGPRVDGECVAGLPRVQNSWNSTYNKFVASVRSSWCTSGQVRGNVTDTLTEVPGGYYCDGQNGGETVSCPVGGPGGM